MHLFLALLPIFVMVQAQANTALPEHSTLPQKFSFTLNLESFNTTIEEPLQNIFKLEERAKSKKKTTTPKTTKRKTTKRKTTKRKTTKRKTTKRKTTTPKPTKPKNTRPKNTKRKNNKTICLCGMENTKRIVGGTKVHNNKYPWTAQLLRGSPFKFFFCGGSLINDRYVLTAAHCVHRLNMELNVRLMQFDRSSDDAGILRKVVRIIVHSQYSPQTDVNDVALLALDSHVNINYHIHPVCLPKVNQHFEGKTAIVAGWGLTKENGLVSDILQEVRVPILSNKHCRQTVYGHAIADGMLCAGFVREGGKDACRGDSGGPLIVQENRNFVLAGVVSFGSGCGEANAPGVYTKVSKFMDWIKKHTSDGRYCTN